MKKRFPILFFVTICFLIPFFIGFIIYDNQFSNNSNIRSIGRQAEVEDRVIDPLDENSDMNNDQDTETKELNKSKNEIAEDKELNSMDKAMEKPEVIETLMSLSEQLDDVNISLQSNNQKEMVSLVQQSLTAYMNQEDSYREDISKAVNIYNKMTPEEQRQVQSKILSNVSVSELLFLKKTFGL